MTIADVVAERGITEVLHFTTHLGLVGVLDSHELRSRDQLRNDQRLEYVLRLNTRRVLDQGWTDFVHLSISRINTNLFDISSIQWHPDVWWAILAFDTEVLSHDGVYFVTTNNAYHQHLRRGTGPHALEALFAPQVKGRYGVTISRASGMPKYLTTCAQAEVMYPRSISTAFLRRVYVGDNDAADEVYGQMSGLNHSKVEVVVDPAQFTVQVG
jgi:hypothetical protein